MGQIANQMALELFFKIKERIKEKKKQKQDNKNNGSKKQTTSDLQGYEQSTDNTSKVRCKLAYISTLDGLDVLCDSRT